MIDSVVLLETPGPDWQSLREALAGKLPGSSRLRRARGVEDLLALVDEESSRDPLAIVPFSLGGEEDSGLLLIPRLLERHPQLPVVVVAERGDVDLAARAIEAGATDFFVLGDRLSERIATLLGKLNGLYHALDRNRRLKEQNARLRESIQARFQMIGESPQITALVDRVRRVAQVPRPILILGERGTGKELVARAIHFAAGSASRPIVAVNCAAFNEALLESELFGHEKGAFTGAESAQPGKFEQADGGTLFLDEIGNMSLPFQRKILRVVEYGTFTRVGGQGELRTEARIIAATNVALDERVREGTFLADLYDRLSFEVLHVPPLREREGDIEMLAHHFLNQFAREIPAFRGKVLSRSALARLKSYPFPGNVRELKNIIERAAYRDTTNEIVPEDLGLSERPEPGCEGGFRDRVDSYAKSLIDGALQRADGNQARAARALGLSYQQFRYYHRKYGS